MIKSFLQLIRQVYALVRPYGRRRLVLVLMAGLLQGVFQAIGVTSIVPFLMLASNPDRFLESSLGVKLLSVYPQLSGETLIVIAGLFSILMLFVANAVSLWADITRTQYAHQFGHWLRMCLVRHVLLQPYSYFFQRNTSVLTKKVVGDVTYFINALLLPLFDVLARVATTSFLLAVLFFFQPVVASVVIVGLGSYYLLVFRLLRARRADLSRRMKESQCGQFVALGQLFGALKMVFARNCGDAFVRRVSRFSGQQARAGAMVPLYGSVPRYALEPIAYGALIVWILVALAGGSNLSAILPTVGVIAMASYRLLPNLQQLYSKLVLLTTSRHSLEEILSELKHSEQINLSVSRRALAAGSERKTALGACPPQPLRTEPPAQNTYPANHPKAWTGSLELLNISYTYPDSNQPALKNIKLTIRKGSTVGFVGPTGSGKSTLADLILGLLTPASGQLLLDGKPLSPADLPCWRAGIGYVPQDVFVLDATIEENIAFGVPEGEVDLSRVREAAQLAQLLDFIEGELPKGFQTPVGERGVCLSGGQRQRIGLARALYTQPQLLILDEATSALDNETESRLLSSIWSLASDITVLTIAHRLSTVVECDTICYMQQGVIEGQGTFDHLKATCEGFRQLALNGSTAEVAA